MYLSFVINFPDLSLLSYTDFSGFTEVSLSKMPEIEYVVTANVDREQFLNVPGLPKMIQTPFGSHYAKKSLKMNMYSVLLSSIIIIRVVLI